jgi:hypothetical protein
MEPGPQENCGHSVLRNFFSEKLYGVALKPSRSSRSAAPAQLFGTPPSRSLKLLDIVQNRPLMAGKSIDWSGLVGRVYSLTFNDLAGCLILQHEQGQTSHLLPG